MDTLFEEELFFQNPCSNSDLFGAVFEIPASPHRDYQSCGSPLLHPPFSNTQEVIGGRTKYRARLPCGALTLRG